MASRVVLHIGLHKTGTTTLQDFLHTRAGFLAKDGLAYPRTPATKGNRAHHRLARAIHDGDIDPLPPPAAKIVAAIRDAQEETAIVSSEMFSLVDPEPLARVLSGLDVRVVAFVRRQDDYLESLYRELKKSSFFLGSKDAFLDAALGGELVTFFTRPGAAEWRAVIPVDYLNLATRWSDAFGADRFTLEVVDWRVPRFDTVDRFMEVVDATRPPEALRPADRNRRFSTGAVQFRHIVDPLLDEQARFLLRPAVWWANQHLPGDDGGSFLTGEDRARVMNTLRKSNDELIARHLSPEAAGFFVADRGRELPHAGELSIESLASMQAGLVAYLEQRLDSQQEEIDRLTHELRRLGTERDS